MAHEVKFRQRATDDLSQIWRHIAQDSELYATAVVTSIIDAVEDLADYPRVGQRLEQFTHLEIRELPVYPYRAFYLVEQETIWVLAVAHGARDLKKPFFDRLK